MLRMRMGRVMALATAGLIPVLLQGCGAAAIQMPTLMTYDGYAELQPGADLVVKPLRAEHYSQPKPIALECNSEGLDCTFGGMPLPAGLEDPRTRNFIQNELMRRSDQMCSMHISRMLYGRTVGNIGSAVIKGAVAWTKPAENIASAIFENAEASLGDESILKWKAYSDTATRIEKSRGAMRDKIRAAQVYEIARYDVSQAMYDAERYHQLCSFATAYSSGDQFETVAKDSVLITPEPTQPGAQDSGSGQSPGPAAPQ